MRKKTKLLLIASAALVGLGIIFFTGAMTMLKWDFKKLSTAKYETNEYAITEAFAGLSVNTDTAVVTLVPAEDGQVKVVCHEQTKIKHTVEVTDGVLAVVVKDTRKWYEHIGFGFGKPHITVYLPGGTYGALSVRASTGNIDVPADFTFESIDISTSTGDVSCRASAVGAVKVATGTGDISAEGICAAALDLSLTTGKMTVTGCRVAGEVKLGVSTGKSSVTDLSCESFLSSGNTGDITLQGVIVAGKLSIERTTGNVTFGASDAAELLVKTDTGDVRGSLKSDKIFFPKTDTGRVEVPKTTVGGKCEITTDTGDITIEIIP